MEWSSRMQQCAWCPKATISVEQWEACCGLFRDYKNYEPCRRGELVVWHWYSYSWAWCLLSLAVIDALWRSLILSFRFFLKMLPLSVPLTPLWKRWGKGPSVNDAMLSNNKRMSMSSSIQTQQSICKTLTEYTFRRILSASSVCHHVCRYFGGGYKS